MHKLIFLQLLLLALTIKSVFAQDSTSPKHLFEVQASGIYQFPTITNTGSPNTNSKLGGFGAAYGYGLHLNYIRPIYKRLSFQSQLGLSEQGRTDNEGEKWTHFLLNAGIGLRYKFNRFQLYSMLIGQSYVGGGDPLFKNIKDSPSLTINKLEIGVNPGILIPITHRFSISASYSKMLTPYFRAALGNDDFRVFRQNVSVGIHYTLK